MMTGSSGTVLASTLLPGVSDHVIGIIGAVAGILGLVASGYFYLRSKERADPNYILRDEVLIDPSTSGTDKFEISYEDVPVRKAVRRATLAIWNAGNKTIDRTDVADQDRPRLVFDDGVRIFTHTVSVPSTAAAGLTCARVDSAVVVDFDFLNGRDGGVIEVLYEGDKTDAPSFSGTIKGVANGFIANRSLMLDDFDGFSLRILPMWTWFLLVVLAAALVYSGFRFDPNTFQWTPGDYISGVIFLIALGLILVGRRQVRSSTPGTILRGLKESDD